MLHLFIEVVHLKLVLTEMPRAREKKYSECDGSPAMKSKRKISSSDESSDDVPLSSVKVKRGNDVTVFPAPSSPVVGITALSNYHNLHDEKKLGKSSKAIISEEDCSSTGNSQANHLTSESRSVSSVSASSESGSESEESNVEQESQNERKNIVQASAGKSSKKKGRKVAVESEREDKKLEWLKSCLRECGIRISSYNKLFDGLMTANAKERKLTEILREAGVDGRISKAKCKQVRLKREEEREVAELDPANIINNSASKRTRARRLRVEDEASASVSVASNSAKSLFKNISDLFESDESSMESDREDNPETGGKLKIVSDDEDS